LYHGNITELLFEARSCRRLEAGVVANKAAPKSAYLVMNGFSQPKHRPFFSNLFVRVLARACGSASWKRGGRFAFRSHHCANKQQHRFRANHGIRKVRFAPMSGHRGT
jgi:hypothetical protein